MLRCQVWVGKLADEIHCVCGGSQHIQFRLSQIKLVLLLPNFLKLHHLLLFDGHCGQAVLQLGVLKHQHFLFFGQFLFLLLVKPFLLGNQLFLIFHLCVWGFVR